MAVSGIMNTKKQLSSYSCRTTVLEKALVCVWVCFFLIFATHTTAAEKAHMSTLNGVVLIDSGFFAMGNSSDPKDGWHDEPVHQVYISGFYMGQTEVTWGVWRRVRDWSATNGYDIANVGMGVEDNHPVYSISWYDAVKWCNARSEFEGLTPTYSRRGGIVRSGEYTSIECDWFANGYRLPTEAEWEKAARGGLERQRFPSGNMISHAVANYMDDEGSCPYKMSLIATNMVERSVGNEGVPNTCPVGSYTPNRYDLYDMAGNVSEWCWDRYDGSYYTYKQEWNPRGSDRKRTGLTVRGGSWATLDRECRVASRWCADASWRSTHIGFRVVRGKNKEDKEQVVLLTLL